MKPLSPSTSLYNGILELGALELMASFDNKIGVVDHIAVAGMIGKLATKGIHTYSHIASSHSASSCAITRYNALAIHNVLEPSSSNHLSSNPSCPHMTRRDTSDEEHNWLPSPRQYNNVQFVVTWSTSCLTHLGTISKRTFDMSSISIPWGFTTIFHIDPTFFTCIPAYLMRTTHVKFK